MSGINANATGDALLAGGTATTPQTFTGFNQFDELTKFKTTRPQLVATDATTNPTANDFLTKTDGDDLYGSSTNDALLDGGEFSNDPQIFTGFNQFDELTKYSITRPQLIGTANPVTPATTDFITKGDGEALFTNNTGDALLDGGTAEAPQSFTGINEFENDIVFEGKIEQKDTGSANLLSQVATGSTINIFSQTGISSTVNSITQVGANSTFNTDGTIEAAGSITLNTAQAGNLNVSTSTNTTNGRLFMGNPPTVLPISGTLPGYIFLVQGGVYIDGEEGIRMPRRGLYNRTGEREWRIDHYSGGGNTQSGVNCLTFNFSATNGGNAGGPFYTKARLQSNGRLELDANLLQNQNFSDARLKTNNKYLENATESLLKLSVQTYDKAKVNNFNLNEPTGETIRETGLIAQEVYYNAPEFRGLVSAGREYNDEFDLSGNQTGDGNPEGTEIIPDEMDLSGVPIGEDPDYEGAGWSKTERASIEYQGFIAYLIKSNQELHERISILEAKVNNM